MQSGLKPEELQGMTVLEIGAGNGRFTEIFLKYGANVVAIDYSTAIDANYRNHSKYIENGRLILLQGDLFNLPIKSKSFDLVFCYGVLQHTGDNQKALNEISRFPKEDKRLYVDIYSNSIKHYNPILYLTRFILGRKKNNYHEVMSLVEKFVSRVFPVQLKILKFLHGKGGIYKYIKYFVNRSPNSVYGINLYLDGKIKKDLDLAYQWSLMDTLDGWASKHDHPVSMRKWKKLLSNTKASNMSVMQISGSGQGHTAVLQKNEVQ